MKVGVLLGTLYAEERLFPDKITPPVVLGLHYCDALVDLGVETYLYSTPSVETKAKSLPGDISLFESVLKKEGLNGVDFAMLHQEHFRNLLYFFELSIAEKAFSDLQDGKIDILHAYHGYTHMFFAGASSEAERVVFTLHDPISEGAKYHSRWLIDSHPNLNYVSVSDSQRKHLVDSYSAHTIYNGIRLEDFDFKSEHGEYVVYMGRMVEEKGVDDAIRVAQELGLPIKLAGNVFAGKMEDQFFEKKVKPYLNKDFVDYSVFVNPEERRKLLANARAYLFPIKWEEPFGLAMIEAMASGTPVVAYNRGSVPEIVKDGKSGYIVDSFDEMKNAVKGIESIRRKDCREHVEKHFSIEKMAKGYLEHFEKILHNGKK